MRHALLALALFVPVLGLNAQDVGTLPAFEVASVKPNKSGNEQMIIRTPPSGLVTATNVNVFLLLRYAYNIPEFRIVDTPKWASADHYDIAAKAPANSAVAQIRLMIRALLGDRFRLVAHTATREMPVDVLTVSRDRNSEPILKPRQDRCNSRTPAESSQTPNLVNCGIRPAFGNISGVDVTVSDLAEALTRMTSRVVIDRTGLSDRYDFSLVYTPDAIGLMDEAAARAEFPRIDPLGPSLKTALKEQLGLTIQSERGPVEVLVIDSVERPTPD